MIGLDCNKFNNLDNSPDTTKFFDKGLPSLARKDVIVQEGFMGVVVVRLKLFLEKL